MQILTGTLSQTIYSCKYNPPDRPASRILACVRDKDGHVKLSDFGLSTGFHKQHDSTYYQRLMESAKNRNSTQAARNSVMVNSINLTMTSKDQIATWKANRRKLVHMPLRKLE